MLRLWPKHFVVGLFQGHCWIRTANTVEIIETAPESEHPDWVRVAFEHALKRILELQGTYSRINVVLASGLATATLLPWQNRHLSEAEAQLYAQAWFNRAGAGLDGGWTIDAGFRFFGAEGFAAAVPTNLLEGLITTAREFKMSLQSVAPVSAFAYWRYSASTRAQRSILFLSEPDRISLMCCEKGRATAFDSQPLSGDSEVALRRLLQRQSHVTADQIWAWSSATHMALPAQLAKLLPDTKLRLLDTATWRPQ